jgi:hypothetical protein
LRSFDEETPWKKSSVAASPNETIMATIHANVDP